MTKEHSRGSPWDLPSTSSVLGFCLLQYNTPKKMITGTARTIAAAKTAGTMAATTDQGPVDRYRVHTHTQHIIKVANYIDKTAEHECMVGIVTWNCFNQVWYLA